MVKICKNCCETKKEESFYVKYITKKKGLVRYYDVCKECHNNRCNENWKNKGRVYQRDKSRKWKANNPIAVRVISINERARNNGKGDFITKEDILFLFKKYENKCRYCRTDVKHDFEIDHRLPYSLGGENTIENLQLVCKTCNGKKNRYHSHAFMKKLWNENCKNVCGVILSDKGAAKLPSEQTGMQEALWAY